MNVNAYYCKLANYLNYYIILRYNLSQRDH